MKCLYCSGNKESLQKLFCNRCDKNIPLEHRTEMQKKYIKTKKKLKQYIKEKYGDSNK